MNTPWPGNVRELKNTLESAAAICLSDQLSLQEIALIRGHDSIKDIQNTSDFNANLGTSEKTLEQHVSELEINLITQALTKFQGNKTHTAQALGITRQGLINKIKRYELA